MRIGGIAQDQIRQIIDRIERLEEEKANLMEDISSVYSEAKHHGYDTKILKKIIRMRKMDAQKLNEEQEVTELYMKALGMLSSGAKEIGSESSMDIEEIEAA